MNSGSPSPLQNEINDNSKYDKSVPVNVRGRLKAGEQYKYSFCYNEY